MAHRAHLWACRAHPWAAAAARGSACSSPDPTTAATPKEHCHPASPRLLRVVPAVARATR